MTMKRNEIMTKIREDVKEQMYQCLFAGMDRMYFEGEYGNGVVQVDLHEVRATSFEIVDVQCYVLHFDGKERHSPNMEQVIIDTLPDWFEMKHQIEDRQTA